MINVVHFTTVFKCRMPNMSFVVLVSCSSMLFASTWKQSKHFSNSKIEIMPKILKSANFSLKNGSLRQTQ